VKRNVEVDFGKWKMGPSTSLRVIKWGKWGIENGKWGMGNGKWGMGK